LVTDADMGAKLSEFTLVSNFPI